MSLDLTKPLRWTTASDSELASLADLQANILKGHGRNHVRLLLLQFDPQAVDSARAFVRKLHVTDALTQLRQTRQFKVAAKGGQTVLLFWLSAAGYRALAVDPAKVPAGGAFRAGLSDRISLLNDPPRADWVSTYRREIHGAILVADDSERRLVKHVRALRASMPSAVRVVGVEKGQAIRSVVPKGEGLEHFGFVDGRSQPLMLEEDIDRQRELLDGVSVWNPARPLAQALLKDPGSSVSGFGSYVVVRRLRQDVRAFRQAERRLARTLGLGKDERARARAGALIVGRFRDGTPVAMQSAAGMHSPMPNNFDYRDDPEGLKCPFQGHIRKVNPRGESATGGGNPEAERRHGIVRRGIPYGPSTLRGGKQPAVGGRASPEVGLIFVCYQADIEGQFEFMQIRWANAPGFLSPNLHPGGPVTGIDPIIGQANPVGTHPDQGHWFSPQWGGTVASANRKQCVLSDLVSMRGGEYFFAPALSTLRNI